ncbi:glycerol-3-phosphate 1-O-acyltransferase PlsY [Litoreibacter arenae]|uniref:Glycerol-3-phosphate acyltransferase n=1 Tax=Litoreibacter arenae DSM 19593 TaxID=1123360 RepID=S9QQ61_9RHOB|nr:glycerol-3-phosphate 1-O-acyltransferase PlsY [Litoreibacter arenae]EPX81787.1 Acyl-phosphate:glycerol-3-phosphate O-acyltransferase PlsY [Litoreibacter arenae DSM 19593]
MPEIVTAPYLLVFVAVASYLLGSIPFGLVIAKAMGLGDLRQIGSGNIGATNVLRTGSKSAALATLLLDAGKGGIAVLLARFLVGEDAAQLAGLAAFIGHIFPVWLNFNGGKGVATYLGTLLALSFFAGLAACLTWLAFALAFRISSLAALAAAALMPLWLHFMGLPDYVLLAALLGALIWMRHAANIRRILSGTEKKIQLKKS